MINTKLRNLLNKYQERLDKIDNPGIYSCTQLKDFILRESMDTQGESFKSVCDAYIEELFKNSKTNYANMMRESEAHFLKFLRGDVRLVDIPGTYRAICRILRKRIEPGDIGDSNEKYADNHKQGDKKRKVSLLKLKTY